MKTSISITPSVFPEKRFDFFAIPHIFIRLAQRGFLIIIAAPGHIEICQQHRQCILFPQGADDYCLFTVLESRQIGAGVFFKAIPHDLTRAICENILRSDAARFRSNTGCIARKRNKIRGQNFRKAPQAQLCGIALILQLSPSTHPLRVAAP